jgi:hypothetical protein
VTFALSLVILAQQPPPAPSGPTAAGVFYLTLTFIFVTAIITTVVTKWARDKCLKMFHRYHVTLERNRGQTIWGNLKVFSNGVEVLYDHPFVDPRGRKKTSYMLYGAEMDNHLLTLCRYHDELDDAQKRARQKQIDGSFNPGPLRRLWRGVRNFVNTLRDAFNAAIGAVVSQYQRVNPAGALVSQGGSVTQIGQTLLSRFAANAYEPLLEQYIGRPVILDVADPINPNNATVEYTGYLADYTQQFIAVFNVEHQCAGPAVALNLPDVEQGPPLPPLPAPPPPGAPAPVLPPPQQVENLLAVRIDGLRFKVQNTSHEPAVVLRLEREGFEPVGFGMILPPMATLDLPARDARGGKLIVQFARCLDVVAPRRYATIRHAGELVERRGIADELYLNQLPLIPKLLRRNHAQRD